MKGMAKIRLFYSGTMVLILPRLKDITNFVLKLICSLFTFKCLRGYLYSSVIHHWNCQLKPYLFPLRKCRVNQSHNLPPLSLLGLRDVFICIRQSDLVSHTLSVSQSYFVSQSFRLYQLVTQTLFVSQSDFVSQSVRLCQLVSQTLSVIQSDFLSYSVRLCQLFQDIF